MRDITNPTDWAGDDEPYQQSVDMTRSLLGSIYDFKIQPARNPANATWIGYGEKHHLHKIGDKFEKGYSLMVTYIIEKYGTVLDPILPISRILRDNFKFACFPSLSFKLLAHLNDDNPTYRGAEKILDDVVSFISNYPFWFKYEHLEKLESLDFTSDDPVLGNPQYDGKTKRFVTPKLSGDWVEAVTKMFPSDIDKVAYVEKVLSQLSILKILIPNTEKLLATQKNAGIDLFPSIRQDYVITLMNLGQNELLKEIHSSANVTKDKVSFSSVDRMFHQSNVTSVEEALKFYQNQEEEIISILREMAVKLHSHQGDYDCPDILHSVIETLVKTFDDKKYS